MKNKLSIPFFNSTRMNPLNQKRWFFSILLTTTVLFLGSICEMNAQRTVTFTGANASWTAPADMTLQKTPSQSSQLISCLSASNVSYPSNNSATGFIQITLNSATEKIDKINIVWRSAAANQVAPIIYAESATLGTVGGVNNVITATNGGFKTTAAIATSGGNNCAGEDVVFPTTATVKTVLIPRLTWIQDAGAFTAGNVYGSFFARLNNSTSTGYSTSVGNSAGQIVGQIVVTISTISSSSSITGAATASAFTTTYGTASAVQSFPVSGSGLTANLVATAPTGFQVSSDGTTFGSTATFIQTSGNASGTLSVRLAPTAVPGGSYNAQNIVLSSTGAINVNISTSATGNTVSTKALSITNLTASDKMYDGSTSVSVSGSAILSGVNGSDAVTLGGTPSYSFVTATAGAAKPVSTSGYTISGAQSSFYTLTQPSLTATISKVPLTITAGDQIVGFGTPESTVTSVASYTATGFVNSETASVITGSPSFITNYTDTTAIGASGITITPTLGTLSAANYSFDTFLAGTITVTSSLTPQSISFTLTSPVAFGSGNITLNGTSTSGLPVSYVSSNPTVASISGNVLTINNVGTTTITASQSGDSTYSAAIPVGQTLEINCGSTSVNTTTITTCEPYIWSNTGQTYAVSGIYDGTTTNCVTERLNLTINTSNTYYVDADGDGFGTGSGTSFCSTTAPAGYATTNTDCDDANATIWRTAILYQDVDGDGYTDKSVSGICYGASVPSGYFLAASSPVKVWNFSDTAKWPTSSGIGSDDIVNDQLGVYPLLLSATTNMGAVNASAITFPVTATTAAFTTTNRFQLNGGGSAVANLPTQRYVYFDVSGSCRVLVWFRTGGSSLRTLYVTDGTNVINSLGSTVTSDNLVLKANYTGGPGRLYIYADQSCNLYKIEVTGATINTPSIVTAPSLSFVPDTTLNTVDNDLDITFTDNAAWRNAVNSIKIGTTSLISGTDYELTAGQLKLKPSGGNGALTTPGTKRLNVLATGYSSSNTGVSQVINAGNVSASISTAAISATLDQNSTSTITCTAKDQYGNAVSGYAFKFDATITNSTLATSETYVIDGVSYTSSTSGVTITAITNASGVATFTVTLPATINYADGISIQVKLADGSSTVGSAFSFTSTIDASITQSPSSANQTICQNDVATPLTVVAPGALTYQWYSNAANSNTGGTLLDGANSSSYTPLTSMPGSSYYYCVVNGVANTLTSDVSGLITINQLVTYFADADGDGYGNSAVTQFACTQPTGYVVDNTDCDDSNASIHTTYSFYADIDGDGYGSGNLVPACAVDALTAPSGYSTNNTDCAPSDSTKHESFTFYADTDGDGYGAGSLVSVCAIDAITPPAGYTLDNTDCAPTNPTIHTTFSFYVDADGDGFGAGNLVSVCALNASTPPSGYSLENTDCNDANATMHTDYPFYADTDGDGYGAGNLVTICANDALTPPAFYSLNNTDCNDANAAIHTTYLFYIDSDGDGFGTGNLVAACAVDALTAPLGYSTIATDCNDNIAAVNPGHVEVLYNGIDDNCDGQLDEGFQMTSDLQTVSCGSTLTSIGSLIYADINLDATAYRFKVENNITGQIQYVDNAHHWFALNWLASYDYTTAYTVSVQLQIDGIWLGYYGSTCVVNSPSITSPSGTLQLIPAQCGATLPNIATIISTTPQSGATGYRFRITDVTPNATGDNLVQVKDRSYHWFTMQMLTRYNYGSTYMIEVAVKTTGGYTGYGSPCYVNTPAVPMLANCGAVVPTRRTLVYTVATKSVTQYRFQVTKVSDQSSVTFDTGRFWFSFRVNVPVHTPNTLYAVRVAVMTAGTWSPFGDACEITSPTVARTNENAELEFDATVFPNPYSDQFSLKINSDSEERIAYKVYDMLGKLIEADELDSNDLETKEIGRNYPAGVYNIIVMQGEERKTLRVIKR